MMAMALILLTQVPVGVSPADLPRYKAALDADVAAAQPVRFRDLWDHSDLYRDRPVRVEGRVVRRFRAGPSGELPARAEWWIATDSDDLICVVFPGSPGVPVGDGDRVSAAGTSLGLIRYAAGDVTRMAPLIVGPRPPTLIAGPGESRGVDWARLDWIVAAVLVGIVGLVLARVRIRPTPKPRPEAGAPVEFES